MTVNAGVGSSITASLGNISFNSAGLAGAITMNGGNGSVSANGGVGTITLNGGAGAVSVIDNAMTGTITGTGSSIVLTVANGNLNLGVLTSSVGAITATTSAAVGAITDNGNITSAGVLTLTSGTTGSVTIANGVTARGTVTTINTPTLNLTGTGAVLASTGNAVIQSNGAGNALTVNAGVGSSITASLGNISFNSAGLAGAITMNGGNGSVSANGGVGTITLNGGAGAVSVIDNAMTGTITGTGSSIVLTVANGNLNLGVLTSSVGAITATTSAAVGAITDNGNITSAGVLTLTSGTTGSVTIANGVTARGTVTTINTPTLNLTGTGAVLASTGNAVIQSNGAGNALTVNAGIGSSISANLGNIGFNSGAAGAITMNGGNGSVSANGGVGTITLNGGAGAVSVIDNTMTGTITGTGSSIVLTVANGNLNLGVLTSSVGAITATTSAAGGTITDNGNITSAGVLTLTSGTAGSVTIANGVTARGTVTTINTPTLNLTGTGSLLATTGALTIQSIAASHALVINAGIGSSMAANLGDINFNIVSAGSITIQPTSGVIPLGMISANGGSGFVNLNIGSNSASVAANFISGTVNDPNVNFSVPAGGNVSVTVASGPLSIGNFAVGSGNSITIVNTSASGTVTTAGDLKAGTTIAMTAGKTASLTIGSSNTITAGTGVILNAPVQNINGVVTATTGDVNIQSNAAGYILAVNMGPSIGGIDTGLIASSVAGNVNFNTSNPGTVTVTGGANNGLISAGNAVYLLGGTGAVNVNNKQITGCIRPTGSSVTIQTSTGDLTFCQGINTSSGSGSGGSIAINALGGMLNMGAIATNGSGGGNSAGNVSLSALNGITVGPINANGIGGASGGTITIVSSGANFTGGNISATGSGAGNGGSVSTSSTTLILANQNTAGNSIDVSASGSGNGGLVSVTTTAPVAFTIGSGAGTGNGTLGNISANGVNGGSIALSNYGTSPIVVNQIINGLITANGTTGAGGMVLFQGQQPAGSALLTVQSNGGSVQATNNADNSGIIGFNGGANQNVSLSGTGIVHAGQVVRVGNLNPNTLALLPVSAGAILLSPSISISNTFETNGFVPLPLKPPTPIAANTSKGNNRLIAQAGKSTNLDLSKTDTDLTPVRGYVNLDEEEDRRRSRRAMRRGRISIIPGAKSYNHIFDSAEISKSIENGVTFQYSPVSNGLNIEKGGVLLSPDKDIVVGTHQGSIHISSGATAFVIQSENDVIIYDLRQSAPKQVTIVVGKEMLTLHPGHMMVLTKQSVDDFEEIDTQCHMISYRGAQQVSLKQNEVKAFIAEFSIASAIVTIDPLNRLIRSTNQQDKTVLAKIVKGAVMLGDFSSTVDLEQMDNLAAASLSQQF